MPLFRKPNKQNKTNSYEWIADNLLGWVLVIGAILGWWSISQSISDLVMPGPIAVGKTLIELFDGVAFGDESGKKSVEEGLGFW